MNVFRRAVNLKPKSKPDPTFSPPNPFLPLEIIELIITHCDDKTSLKHLSLASKLTLPSSHHKLFSSECFAIHINQTKAEQFTSLVKSPLNTLCGSHLVLELDLQGDPFAVRHWPHLFLKNIVERHIIVNHVKILGFTPEQLLMLRQTLLSAFRDSLVSLDVDLQTVRVSQFGDDDMPHWDDVKSDLVQFICGFQLLEKLCLHGSSDWCTGQVPKFPESWDWQSCLVRRDSIPAGIKLENVRTLQVGSQRGSYTSELIFDIIRSIRLSPIRELSLPISYFKDHLPPIRVAQLLLNDSLITLTSLSLDFRIIDDVIEEAHNRTITLIHLSNLHTLNLSFPGNNTYEPHIEQFLHILRSVPRTTPLARLSLLTLFDGADKCEKWEEVDRVMCKDDGEDSDSQPEESPVTCGGKGRDGQEQRPCRFPLLVQVVIKPGMRRWFPLCDARGLLAFKTLEYEIKY